VCPIALPIEMGFRDATIPSMPRCPTCRSLVRPRSENPAFPFCAPRCRAVDLGRWFTGNYCVPGEPAPDTSVDREDKEHDDKPH